ncbi:heme exporter protein CcmD [Niveispirillum lacus]|uniref:Heme exporter protein D n=1 Tax=Niveispirillum lacus TaxID=1981099 RepID=A0A255Z3J3_9PROT|nr:heme exporter protein CcmD [Niveispirillum lacus]OYQ35240.1 heme exporter protein CcmD [Niveispirillum lacus]
MADFFHMGGYAIYVWSSYGVALVVLAGLLMASLSGLRRKERMLATLEQTLPRRRRRSAAAPSGDEAGSTLHHGTTGKDKRADDATKGGDDADGGSDGGGGE